ncbi:hypothetical protein Nepgr_005200 [Nepenthes gracilis]|uniref:Uncharacterized protein n=1 Tax=Nepenthes gracilis TaxID=150966 RepID=A0AAD3XGC7_NEPGR|nr:hypothetical protein Nepgr_005200 [Nepenthes gracilis]
MLIPTPILASYGVPVILPSLSEESLLDIIANFVEEVHYPEPLAFEIEPEDETERQVVAADMPLSEGPMLEAESEAALEIVAGTSGSESSVLEADGGVIDGGIHEVASAKSSEPEVHEALEVPTSDIPSKSISISEMFERSYWEGIGLRHIIPMVAPSVPIFILHPRNANAHHSSDVLYRPKDDVTLGSFYQ